jgi:hypothetical protein
VGRRLKNIHWQFENVVLLSRMGRPQSVLGKSEWDEFRSLVSLGREQYKLTIADICDASINRELEDLRSRYPNEVSLAVGYNTKAKRHKLIENALARPTTRVKAELILAWLFDCRKAAAWRRHHPGERDEWFVKWVIRGLRSATRLSELGPETSGAPIAFIHPASALALAESLANDLVAAKLVKKRHKDAAAHCILTRIRLDASAHGDSFLRWLRKSRSHLDVYVREERQRLSESHTHILKQITVYAHDGFVTSPKMAEGERMPEHDEYVTGLFAYAERQQESDGASNPIIIKEFWHDWP